MPKYFPHLLSPLHPLDRQWHQQIEPQAANQSLLKQLRETWGKLKHTAMACLKSNAGLDPNLSQMFSEGSAKDFSTFLAHSQFGVHQPILMCFWKRQKLYHRKYPELSTLAKEWQIDKP